ncbi:MAG: ABC-2 transporter permease, partial [Acholeplasma sp.]|nr:ABC-2 transporter permease [Acholeplasma sp.]
MKNLLFKELTLTIGKFFYLLPLLLGLLFFIPNWIFTLVPMYFFWISIPNIFSSYSAQLDYPFLSLLPVTKANIVVAKTVSIYIIQGIHIIFALIFGIIHNLIYGQYNFFLQINP